MDFELSRSIERIAQLETEMTKLEAALSLMNQIVRHQINEPVFGGPKHFFHPYTCGNESSHGNLFPYWTGTEVVLKCPDCDYVQKTPARLSAGRMADLSDDDVGC